MKNIGIQSKLKRQDDDSATRTYGCEIPKNVDLPEELNVKQYEIPSVYKEFLDKPKANTFGLGYEGLDRSHVNLFQSSNFVVRGKNNEKLTISGKAFGVGAFEEEDEDIYMKEDMSQYDFELTREKKLQKKSEVNNLVFGMFTKSQAPLVAKEIFPPPKIPHSFTGKHKVKRSRFEPLPEPAPVERSEMNPEIRARCLGETDRSYTASKPIIEKPKIEPKPAEEPPPKKQYDLGATLAMDRFVSASKPEDTNDILAPVEKMESEHGTKDLREAARMKMFGPLTRITTDWHPSPVLCKRFNIPEPNFE